MNLKGKKTLITGAAGFIGCETALRLVGEGVEVVGVDNMNHYYDVNLKKARLKRFQENPHWKFYELDICDRAALHEVFHKEKPNIVLHLAAQAGVRHSLKEPLDYVDSNLVGFGNVLEYSRQLSLEHLVFASSSSVYGANTKVPFSVHDNVDHPVSLYAATKKANELMAHSYSHLYNLPCTGLRFFTVYGPWGRPDMAYFSFTEDILSGRPIQVFNNGKMRRDFTYIDDIIEGVYRILPRPPQANDSWDRNAPDPGSSYAPYRVYNIGNNKPVELMTMIEILEDCLGKKAEKVMLPMQPGDVVETFAVIEDLTRDFGYQPDTPLRHGLEKFAQWRLEWKQNEK